MSSYKGKTGIMEQERVNCRGGRDSSVEEGNWMGLITLI